MKQNQNIDHVLLLAGLLIAGLLAGCSDSSGPEWKEEDHYRWADLSTGFFGKEGFRELTPRRTGIRFVNRLTESEIAFNRHYLNGSGVAAGDIDGDGWIDLYFAGLSSPNRLYRNLGGMNFEDITEEAGVAHNSYYSTGALFADVNGNGFLDLIVTSMHGETALYQNNGEGVFNRLMESGLEGGAGGMTMAMADITGNGYPDLYITRYKERSVKDLYTTDELEWHNILREPLASPSDPYSLIPPFDTHYELIRENGNLIGISELGEVDQLYLNHGGRFELVQDTEQIFLDVDGAPFGLQRDWGLTAKFQDLNGNGLQDLYVCNDFHTPDRIWMNQGDGTFRAVHWSAIRNLSYSCMGVDFSDLNRDGKFDIFTTEMLSPDHEKRLSQAGSDQHLQIRPGELKARPMYNRNSLFLQREDETYAEISRYSGVSATGWSWATRFLDVDLDGYEDLIVTTGYPYDILDIDAQISMMNDRRNMDEHFLDFVERTVSLEIPNRALRNNGDLTFTDAGREWGLTVPDVSHGMAVADLNNDGDQDLVINRLNSEAAIYENRTQAPRISVLLRGERPNSRAVGARVELTGGPVPSQVKQIVSGGDYLSGSGQMVTFAADGEKSDHTLTVTWPDGQVSHIGELKPNRMIEIYESDKRPVEPEHAVILPPVLFEEQADRIAHRHHESDFTDWQIQPLLPRTLAREGPGIAWLDLNQDGQEDLVIGTGAGGSLSIFENLGEGRFTQLSISPLTDAAPGDQTGLIGWSEGDKTRLVVGSSNYEQGSSTAASAYIYSLAGGTAGQPEVVGIDSLPGTHASTGPLAAADLTGNGYPDLFVGGRFLPGRYPAGAGSRIFLNDGERFRFSPGWSELLSEAGLVTGALFGDLTGNGRQDLLISTELGTVRLYENIGDGFRERTEEAGLGEWSGWWQGVTVGDFTNNGLPDIVATNLGKNSSYRIREGEPLRVYYGDLNQNGRMDIVEAYVDEKSGEYVPVRPLFTFQQSQLILNRMGSHREFAASTLREIIGERLDGLNVREARTLEHMLFLNRGGRFEALPLPAEAQFTTGGNLAVADVDLDGNEDLFISQNLFAFPDEVPRSDAGRGLVLLGQGDGSFIPLNGSRSGVKMYGEQRGAAIGDATGDGKPDLAVSQNAAETNLFFNRADRSGIRIKLVGPESNRNAAGSSLRLTYRDGTKGARRYIRAGSGNGSQDGYLQVLGAAGEPAGVEVTWFDGSVVFLEREWPAQEWVIEY
ncbi:MAG: VCBS repeat-containing protein [Balneolaceae bacterium]